MPTDLLRTVNTTSMCCMLQPLSRVTKDYISERPLVLNDPLLPFDPQEWPTVKRWFYTVVDWCELCCFAIHEQLLNRVEDQCRRCISRSFLLLDLMLDYQRRVVQWLPEDHTASPSIVETCDQVNQHINLILKSSFSRKQHTPYFVVSLRDPTLLEHLSTKFTPVKSEVPNHDGGLDWEWVTDTERKELSEWTCGICMEATRSPVYCGLSPSHRFCRSCIETYVRSMDSHATFMTETIVELAEERLKRESPLATIPCPCCRHPNPYMTIVKDEQVLIDLDYRRVVCLTCHTQMMWKDTGHHSCTTKTTTSPSSSEEKMESVQTTETVEWIQRFESFIGAGRKILSSKTALITSIQPPSYLYGSHTIFLRLSEEHSMDEMMKLLVQNFTLCFMMD